jgi:YkoY family integral membrane protein
MFGIEQTFSFSDLPKVFFLSFLEIILSVDNVIIITMLIARLPEKLHKKAFLIGSVSAICLRAGAILSLSVLVQYHWVQGIAAAYLLYLSISHFCFQRKSSLRSQTSSLWKTIILIELFDLVFALDSILAGMAFITSDQSGFLYSKLWIVYVGGVIGLLGIRYLSHLLSKVLRLFPRMESSAHVMIGWIGCKLVYTLFPHPLWFELVFWVVLVIIFGIGFMKREKKNGR